MKKAKISILAIVCLLGIALGFEIPVVFADPCTLDGKPCSYRIPKTGSCCLTQASIPQTKPVKGSADPMYIASGGPCGVKWKKFLLFPCGRVSPTACGSGGDPICE